MSAGLVSSEASLLGLLMSFSQCSHIVLPLWKPVQISLSRKDISRIGLGPTRMISFYLNYLFIKNVSPNMSHIEVLGVRTSTYELGGGHNSAHSKSLWRPFLFCHQACNLTIKEPFLTLTISPWFPGCILSRWKGIKPVLWEQVCFNLIPHCKRAGCHLRFFFKKKKTL